MDTGIRRIVFLGLVAVLLISCGGPRIGERGRLVSGAKQIAVAVSTEAFDAYLKALNANDAFGVGVLVTSGQVFTVPSNTPVLVLEGGALKMRVRILSGDNTGQSGWVPVEYVKR